ncbi:hypothetical protein HDU93_002715 [Gonapodya sp. JEL0774]|nr:hypothetical protein HDU93_002715 [Gonapodya sp. JEL0774]
MDFFAGVPSFTADPIQSAQGRTGLPFSGPNVGVEAMDADVSPLVDAYDPQQVGVVSLNHTSSWASRGESNLNNPGAIPTIPMNGKESQDSPKQLPEFNDSVTHRVPTVGESSGYARGRGSLRGRGGRDAPILAGMGSRMDHSKTSIVIERIPEEHLSTDSLNHFFRKFGTITNITLESYQRRAVIQFSNAAEANAAYRSPEPVFDNRFVRIFFYRPEQESGSVANAGRRPPQPTTQLQVAKTVPESSTTVSLHGTVSHPKEQANAPSEPLLSSSSSVPRSIERIAVKATLLQEKRQELLTKIAEKQKALGQPRTSVHSATAPLPIPEGTSSSQVTAVPAVQSAQEKERLRLDRELELLSNRTPEDGVSPMGNQHLKDKIAALKSKVAATGQDPNHIIDTAFVANGAMTSNGRGIAGAYISRGVVRSTIRGYGRGAGVRHMAIDNRPRSLVVKNAPADFDVRAFLEEFGEIDGISFLEDNSGTVVKFKSRRDAEVVRAAFNSANRTLSGDKTLSIFWEERTLALANAITLTTDGGNPELKSGEASDGTQVVDPLNSRSMIDLYDDQDDEDDERAWKR